MNAWEFEKRINQYTAERSTLDVVAVYEALKDQYALILTNAFALENGKADYGTDYTMVCGTSSVGNFRLYDNGLYGVFDVDKVDGGYAHWHPSEVSEAIEDIKLFMCGICKE